MERVRVALIGCGGIANAHSQAYSRLVDVIEVVAVCDTNEEAARKRAGQLGVKDVYRDYREVIERPDIEAVDLCLPHHLHAPVAIESARAGKHVFVEKPIATSLDEAAEMVRETRSRGLVLQVGQNQRYVPAFVRLRELLQEGVLGDVYCIRADCNQHLGGILPEGHWLYSRRKAGGGVVISVAVHKLDLMRFLIGDVRRVTAFQTRSPLHPTMDCEDVAVAALEFECGAVGEMTALYAAKQRPWNEMLIIYGTKGVVHNVNGIHIYSEAVDAWSRGLTKADFAEDWSDSVYLELKDFARCIRTGDEPRSSGLDNLGTLAVIDAWYRSAASGRAEDVRIPRVAVGGSKDVV